MRFIRGFQSSLLASCLIYLSLLHATEYSPWFDPLLELKGQLSYSSSLITHFSSENKPFKRPSHHHTMQIGLLVTPWPYWNMEAEFFFTQTQTISFSYESARLTLRHQLIDDFDHVFTLVTGITSTLPASHVLHQVDFLYRSHFEMELHFTIGKEWQYHDHRQLRFWVLGGTGLNMSQGWLHGLSSLEVVLNSLKMAFFIESYFGLGTQALTPLSPFPGYGSVAYRRANLGAKIDYEMPYLGDIEILTWRNVWAENSMFHDWGIKIALWFPILLL